MTRRAIRGCLKWMRALQRFEWLGRHSRLAEMGVLPDGVRKQRFAVTAESPC